MNTAAQKDSAELDKTYVPALFYSSVGMNELLTQDALNTLDGTNSVWSSFKAKYANYYNWGSYFGAVDANIATASDHYAGILDNPSATYPADLTTAHDALESMRDTWSSMREASGIRNYFFDKITAAHHTMEPVAGANKVFLSSAQSADDALTLQNALIAVLPDFSADWSNLVDAYGDGDSTNGLYDFGTDKAAALAKNISNADPVAPGMAQMIANLTSVLETCDTTSYTPVAANYTKGTYNSATADACDTMIYVSSMIKSKFVPVFVAFGDFLTAFMSEVTAGSRALIPALYCTGNPPDAATTCGGKAGTLNLLNAYAGAMMGFGMHLPQSDSMNLPKALGWKDSMDTAGVELENAMVILGASADLAEAKAAGAHEAIEGIRTAMHYMCSDYENITTMMTELNEYHAVFEDILLIATDAGAPKPSLTAQEVADIGAL
ncbi:MAG: hypothetical protein OQK32_09005, partial [Gammaproteobacteria bacterium]|nr:hypothetical protein [Gammaproteobacteria bacterium]